MYILNQMHMRKGRILKYQMLPMWKKMKSTCRGQKWRKVWFVYQRHCIMIMSDLLEKVLLGMWSWWENNKLVWRWKNKMKCPSGIECNSKMFWVWYHPLMRLLLYCHCRNPASAMSLSRMMMKNVLDIYMSMVMSFWRESR